MRSSSFCSFLNRGEALRMIPRARIKTSAVKISRMVPRVAFSWKDSARAMMQTSGTRQHHLDKAGVSANWMVVMSENGSGCDRSGSELTKIVD